MPGRRTKQGIKRFNSITKTIHFANLGILFSNVFTSVGGAWWSSSHCPTLPLGQSSLPAWCSYPPRPAHEHFSWDRWNVSVLLFWYLWSIGYCKLGWSGVIYHFYAIFEKICKFGCASFHFFFSENKNIKMYIFFFWKFENILLKFQRLTDKKKFGKEKNCIIC